MTPCCVSCMQNRLPKPAAIRPILWQLMTRRERLHIVREFRNKPTVLTVGVHGSGAVESIASPVTLLCVYACSNMYVCLLTDLHNVCEFQQQCLTHYWQFQSLSNRTPHQQKATSEPFFPERGNLPSVCFSNAQFTSFDSTALGATSA